MVHLTEQGRRFTSKIKIDGENLFWSVMQCCRLQWRKEGRFALYIQGVLPKHHSWQIFNNWSWSRGQEKCHSYAREWLEQGIGWHCKQNQMFSGELFQLGILANSPMIILEAANSPLPRPTRGIIRGMMLLANIRWAGCCEYAIQSSFQLCS